MKKPCPTCPFLLANKGKPTPTNFKCVEQNETDWYSQENIDGVWEVMRKNPIAFLSCHTTDPDYYGIEGKPIYACVGAALCVFMHLKIFGKCGVYYKYVNLVGKKVAMDKKVMGEKLMAVVIGRTSIDWGEMLLPRSVEIDLDTLRLPTGFERTMFNFK